MKLKPLLFFCCIAVSVTTSAQTKPVKPAVAPAIQKFKPPRLYTSIGTQKDSIINIGVTDAVNLVNQPITVTDDKKGVYSITSYQCLYKRKTVTEDEETGKVSPTTFTVVQQFTSTPLSEIWRKTIYEQLKPGEEISFFDIVVKDSQNRLMFAPGFKIIVK